MATYQSGKYKGMTVLAVGAINHSYSRWYLLNTPIIDPELIEELFSHVKQTQGENTLRFIKSERQKLFRTSSAKWDWDTNERTEKTEYTKRKFESFGEQVGETRHSSKLKSASPGIQKSSLDALALKWFRESAKKWHPDLCRGNSEPMKAVNDCYERFKDLISKL